VCAASFHDNMTSMSRPNVKTTTSERLGSDGTEGRNASFNFMPHFMDSYFAAQIHKVQSSGLDAATTAAQVAAIQRSQQLYQNPFVNMAYTFMEPLPSA
jgi:hypothetical protein